MPEKYNRLLNYQNKNNLRFSGYARSGVARLISKMKTTFKITSVISIIFCLFLVVNICWAQDKPILPADTPTPGSCPSGYEGNCGNYSLNQMVSTVINVSQFILGITGSLALLAFIYGGVMFLISAGNAERVTQAKQIIIGAVIGMVIVFTSFMIIQFVYTALNIPGAESGKWATSGWFNK